MCWTSSGQWRLIRGGNGKFLPGCCQDDDDDDDDDDDWGGGEGMADGGRCDRISPLKQKQVEILRTKISRRLFQDARWKNTEDQGSTGIGPIRSSEKMIDRLITS